MNEAALIDTVRYLTELLEDVYPASVGMLSPWWYEERDYIVAVARRQLREVDPQHVTDRRVR